MDWESKCIVATKQHRSVNKLRHSSSILTNSLRDTGDNISHMLFNGEPAVKLHVKNVKVGNGANGNPRQDQVTMGRVDSPASTNH